MSVRNVNTRNTVTKIHDLLSLEKVFVGPLYSIDNITTQIWTGIDRGTCSICQSALFSCWKMVVTQSIKIVLKLHTIFSSLHTPVTYCVKGRSTPVTSSLAWVNRLIWISLKYSSEFDKKLHHPAKNIQKKLFGQLTGTNFNVKIKFWGALAVWHLALLIFRFFFFFFWLKKKDCP